MLDSNLDEEDVDDSGDTTIMSVPALDETTADPKKKKKKEYGKLPPRSAKNSESSQDAASDAIKQYFNRG